MGLEEWHRRRKRAKDPRLLRMKKARSMLDDELRRQLHGCRRLLWSVLVLDV